MDLIADFPVENRFREIEGLYVNGHRSINKKINTLKKVSMPDLAHSKADRLSANRLFMDTLVSNMNITIILHSCQSEESVKFDFKSIDQ